MNIITFIKNTLARIMRYFLPVTSRTKAVRLGVLIVSVILIVFILGKNNSTDMTSESLPPTVFVGTVSDITASEGASFVGTVRAVSEAQIQSEVGGRVTAVYVKPGDQVTAGAILASLENASQQASLLSAQGSYEAALASAAQSEVSSSDAQTTLLSAQNNAVSTYRDAYTSVNTVVLSDIDTFFSNPNSILIPGVRVNTDGNATYLNNTRIALGKTLTAWKDSVNALTTNSDLDSALKNAKAHTQSAIDMADILITAVSEADSNDTLDGEPLSSYLDDLTGARATLNSTLSNISSAESTLTSARDNVRRAEISGTQNTEVSLANAQVKQALGALRSAQASYEKTVFRSSIAGTVNSMRVNVGDYIGAFTQVAEIANNDALQISIYAGEADLARFTVGGTVRINDSVTGTITSVAPAVDSVTQKTEVKIAAESTELTNGSSVTVTLDNTLRTTESANLPLQVPITAIKFSATDGVIFTIEDGILKSKAIEIGPISGSFVTVSGNITRDTVFVLDARGLSEGQRVEAIKK